MDNLIAPVAERAKKQCHDSFERVEKEDTERPVECAQAQASYHMILQDKAMETMVRARVAAATVNAVGSVVKETVAVVAGCRGAGQENCKALLGYVNKGTEKVEEVALHIATQMGAQPVIKRMVNMDGTALTQRLGELGIDREPNGQLFQVNAKQYVQDCKTVALAAAGTGGVIGATKLFRTGASSGGPTGAIGNFLKDECGGVKLPISREYWTRQFESIGYEVVPGGKGSHIKLRRPNSPMVMFPDQRELKPSFVSWLNRMLKQESSKK